MGKLKLFENEEGFYQDYHRISMPSRRMKRIYSTLREPSIWIIEDDLWHGFLEPFTLCFGWSDHPLSMHRPTYRVVSQS